MKTSKKALLLVAGIVLALLMTGLYGMRRDLQTFVSSGLGGHALIPISVQPFDRITIEPNWDVTVRKGRSYEVKIFKADSGRIRIPVTVDGELRFVQDSNRQTPVKARVLVRNLEDVRVIGGQLTINDFENDSLQIFLEDAVFIGQENLLEKLTFQTEGSNRITWIDDPFK